MPHFRLDDALHSHPKAQRAGDEALGMWARAGSFCMAYLTNGFVPEWWVRQQPKGIAKANKLILAGLWHGGAERDGEKGYQFHEFVGPGRQDSREQVEAEREKWRKKKAAQRGDTPAVSPGDTQGDSPKESLHVTRDPTQPNPKEKSFGYVPESATESTARDSIAATPGAELVRRTIPREINSAIQTELRIRANALVKEGTASDVVEEALRDWATKTGVGPGLLPSLAADVIKRRNGHTAHGPPQNGRPSKVRSLAQLTAETRAREQQELQTAGKPKELT